MNSTNEISLLSKDLLPKLKRRNHPILVTQAPLIKKRKKRAKKEGFLNGRWGEKEHIVFLQLFKIFGNDWKGIERLMKNRTSIQIRSHAQKYLVKLMKKYKVLKDNKFVPKPSLMKKIEKDDLKFFVEFGLSNEKRIFHIEKDLKSMEKFKIRSILRDSVETSENDPSFESCKNVIQTVQSFSILRQEKKFIDFISEKIKFLISSNERILKDLKVFYFDDLEIYPELFEFFTENTDKNIDFIGTQTQVSSLLLLYKEMKELDKEYLFYQ